MADGYGHIRDTADTLTLSTPAQKQCRVIVVGNEKGGAGKEGKPEVHPRAIKISDEKKM